MKIRILLLIFMIGFGQALLAQSLDLKLLDKINSPVNPGPDKTWRFVTDKSRYVNVALPLSIAIAGFIKNDKELKTKAYEIGASELLAQGASFIVKRTLNRERPYLAHSDLITGKQFPTDPSMPSGHASNAFATATSLSLAFPKWYVIAPSFLYAGAVGYSRTYLGVHYPSDVLAGALLGSATAYFTFKAQKWLVKRKRQRTKILIE